MMDIKNKFSLIFFIIILLLFTVGGFFLKEYFLDMEKDVKEKEVIIEVTDNRIDKEKDYIYFVNESHPIDGNNIQHKDIVINLKGHDSISNLLNTKTKEFMNNLKYTKDLETPIENTDILNEEGIYSFYYYEYDIINFDNTVAIVVYENEYNIINQTIPKNIMVYYIDKENNKELKETDILKNEGYDIENIKKLVKEKLDTLKIEKEDIDIENTMNNLKYAVYVNKIGKLEISYIVNSTKGNYYDKLVLD